MNNDFEELEKRLNRIIESQKSARIQRNIIILMLLSYLIYRFFITG